MNFFDVLDFPVNYVTARNVLALKGLREDVPNVVLRHDYDSLENWKNVLEAERKLGLTSSNYLLMNNYDLPIRRFKEYEVLGFEFGLHQNFKEQGPVVNQVLAFLNLGLNLRTMTPHGWAEKNGEYPTRPNNWSVDRFYKGPIVSMNYSTSFATNILDLTTQPLI